MAGDHDGRSRLNEQLGVLITHGEVSETSDRHRLRLTKAIKDILIVIRDSTDETELSEMWEQIHGGVVAADQEIQVLKLARLAAVAENERAINIARTISFPQGTGPPGGFAYFPQEPNFRPGDPPTQFYPDGTRGEQYFTPSNPDGTRGIGPSASNSTSDGASRVGEFQDVGGASTTGGSVMGDQGGR